MVLWGSILQGGIKEEVEKSLINQFGDSAQLSMKKMMLTKEMRIQIEKKVHQRFFKDFIYVSKYLFYFIFWCVSCFFQVKKFIFTREFWPY